MNLKSIIRNTLWSAAAGSMLFLSACDDETPEPDMEMPTGMLTVSDQMLSQNTIMVSNVDLDQNGWIVVHASTSEGGPVVPQIISEPVMVEAGSQDNIEVPLTDVTNLSDGDVVYVMLHTDNGTMGEYEFDGQSGIDNPITTENGAIVMDDITISSASITVSGQAVNENMVTIDEVKASVDGWLVIHADDGNGAPGPVLGQTMVSAGTNTNVMVDLGDNVFTGGEMLFPMLHIESPDDGEYGFPENGDDPEVFGEDVIVTSFEVMGPTGSITVMDQIIQGNTLTVGEITTNATGWVVVHASNANNDGPQVPEIISTPVQLQAGTSTDVAIELTEAVNADDVVYVMLHTDNGVIGAYEFDGSNGFDGPAMADGNMVIESVTALAPAGTFTANNQTVSQNTLMVESITVDQPSWLVVHRDNGTGEGFVAPGIISNPVAIEAGTTENVEITLADGEELADGERLWIMIHNDNGTVSTYEFDGANGFDLPIYFASIDIMAPSVTVSNQIVSVDNTVTIDEVNAGVDGWIVIHADNGSGEPGAVLGQTFVEAGTTANVEVDLGDATVNTGDTLFPMLHVEDPEDGEYGFPDNGDGPEVFNEDVVVVSFEVL